MTFKDYDEIGDRLRLPIGGKTYTVPPVDVDAGIRINRMRENPDEATLSNDEFARLVLGDVVDELVADKVPWAAFNRAASTALAYALYGADVAEHVWNGDPAPKASPEPTKAPSTPRRASGTTRTNPNRSRGRKS